MTTPSYYSTTVPSAVSQSVSTLAVLADQGTDEPVGGVVGLHPNSPFGAQPAPVDPVLCPARTPRSGRP